MLRREIFTIDYLLAKDKIDQTMKDGLPENEQELMCVALEFINLKRQQSERVVESLQGDFDKLDLAFLGIYPNPQESRIFPHSKEKLSEWIENNEEEARRCYFILEEFISGNSLPLAIYASIKANNWKSLITEQMKTADNPGAIFALGRAEFWDRVTTLASTATLSMFEVSPPSKN